MGISIPPVQLIKRPGVGARLGLAPSTCDPHFFIRVGLGLTLPLPFFLKKSFAPRSRAKPASFLHRELSEGDEPRGYNITSSRGELFALAIKNAKRAGCPHPPPLPSPPPSPPPPLPLPYLVRGGEGRGGGGRGRGGRGTRRFFPLLLLTERS